MVECLTVNQEVAGSSPAPGVNTFSIRACGVTVTFLPSKQRLRVRVPPGAIACDKSGDEEAG